MSLCKGRAKTQAIPSNTAFFNKRNKLPICRTGAVTTLFGLFQVARFPLTRFLLASHKQRRVMCWISCSQILDHLRPLRRHMVSLSAFWSAQPNIDKFLWHPEVSLSGSLPCLLSTPQDFWHLSAAGVSPLYHNQRHASCEGCGRQKRNDGHRHSQGLQRQQFRAFGQLRFQWDAFNKFIEKAPKAFSSLKWDESSKQPVKSHAGFKTTLKSSIRWKITASFYPAANKTCLGFGSTMTSMPGVTMYFSTTLTIAPRVCIARRRREGRFVVHASTWPTPSDQLSLITMPQYVSNRARIRDVYDL